MRLAPLLLAGLAGLPLAACASSSPSTDAGAAPSAAAATGDSPVRWTGTFSPTSQRTGEMSGSDRARTYGNVSLQMSPTDRNRTRVRMSITVPTTVANQGLRWAILTGRCGSGSLPVMATNLFPPMEVGANARAETDVEIPFTIPTSGSFHVNVFWPGGSDQLENVMTCSNLRRD